MRACVCTRDSMVSKTWIESYHLQNGETDTMSSEFYYPVSEVPPVNGISAFAAETALTRFGG